jgi:hypothetical protein
MQPLFTVHNNVSLLSVTIAPSTFLAALTLALVFLSLYLPRLPSLPLPRLFSFGWRRTGNDDKDIALKRRQRIANDLGDSYDDFLDTRQWRNREPLSVDWRHRQLPPLPPPPFRPLLSERGYIEEYDDPKNEDPAGIFRKKKSSRSDRDKSAAKDERERQRGKEREKEKAGKRLGQDKKSSKSSTPSKIRHNSRYTIASATTGSAKLVVHSSRCDNVDVYDPHSQSSDDSDREERRRQIGQQPCDIDIDINGDAAGWLSSGFLGRVTSRFRPGQQSVVNAVYLSPPRTPVTPPTPPAERESAGPADVRNTVDPFGLPRDRQRGERKYARFSFRRWLQSAGMASPGKRRP